MPDILIIEDNDVTIKSIEHLLEKEGCNVVTAANGKEAVRLLDQFDFDLVVTDLLMPFMSGLDVVRYIKNDLKKTTLPIIVVSSVKDEKSKMEAYNMGVDVFLTKPYTPHELVTFIRKFTGPARG